MDDSLAQSDSDRLAVLLVRRDAEPYARPNRRGFYRIPHFGSVDGRLYRLFWDEFSGWYLEMVKPGTGNADRGDDGRYESVLRQVARTLHPFMPFITEEIWQHMAPRKDGESITVAALPAPQPLDQALLEPSNNFKEAVSSVRNIRKSTTFRTRKRWNCTSSGRQLSSRIQPAAAKMANLEPLEEIAEKAFRRSRVHRQNDRIFRCPAGHAGIDVEEELRSTRPTSRLPEKRFPRLRSEKNCRTNVSYKNAPAKVIETEHAKRHDAEAKIKALKERTISYNKISQDEKSPERFRALVLT